MIQESEVSLRREKSKILKVYFNIFCLVTVQVIKRVKDQFQSKSKLKNFPQGSNLVGNWKNNIFCLRLTNLPGDKCGKKKRNRYMLMTYAMRVYDCLC